MWSDMTATIRICLVRTVIVKLFVFSIQCIQLNDVHLGTLFLHIASSLGHIDQNDVATYDVAKCKQRKMCQMCSEERRDIFFTTRKQPIRT